MLSIRGLAAYTIDWQHLVCLLYALRETGNGIRKYEAITFIRSEGFLELTAEDNTCYPTQSEPSWHTDIAYARKIGVIMGIVSYEGWDSWGLTHDGIVTVDSLLKSGQSGKIDGAACFLWSSRFKNIFDSDYAPSAKDVPRPPKLHRRVSEEICLDWARQQIEKGAGDSVAKVFSERLGFEVRNEIVSLAFARKMLLEDPFMGI